ncbi:MAG: OprO/OprP family phosphate-selective porin [Dysgonamonadaceae bacterium]|jgi:hypothetical protein|nr:OprO/OprP family phosphate-selective porin [Dysgonamonadaceae bacterium]
MKKLFFLCFLFSCTASYSQQHGTERTKRAFRSEQFNLSGYGQAVAGLSKSSFAGVGSSFDVQRVILFATGSLGTHDKFGYMLMLDLGPNISMQEMYGEWLPYRFLNIRFGQYKIPFTIENPMSASRFETVYPSRSVSAMSGSSGDFNQFDGRGVKAGRDVGLMFSGRAMERDGFHLLEYSAGLFNGTGLNTRDNNNAKDFVGSAYIQPINGLKVGGSFYSGKITLSSDTNGLSHGNHRRKAYSTGLVFDSRYFYVRSEYISNRTGDLRRQGFYVSGLWRFVPGRWEVVGKYDLFDSDCSLSRNEVTDLTFGVNYFLAYLTKIQVDYILTDDLLQGLTHSAAVQLQIFF